MRDSQRGVQETVMTKAYAAGSTFEGADMSNAVVDRVDFSRANLKGVKFTNAVVTGAFFEGADLTGADFEDALIGGEDAKRLCAPCRLPCRLRHTRAHTQGVVCAPFWGCGDWRPQREARRCAPLAGGPHLF